MEAREKLSNEAKMLIREYALRVARKKYPNANIDVHVDDYLDENGLANRIVTILPGEAEA